jgi:alpha,alpha-trehalose phosphorylase
MGCFWGAERILWDLEGVWTTFVGYAGGFTPQPDVPRGLLAVGPDTPRSRSPCTTLRSSASSRMLVPFWEQHDPTQGMRQGNDVGTQYRSIILTTGDEQARSRVSAARYQAALDAAGHGRITTTIEPLRDLYHAEEEHQQYLAKHPGGYCNHGFCQTRLRPRGRSMIPRRLRIPPEDLYPEDDWRIVETRFTDDWMGNAETIFALSNGFIGIRGLVEEARPAASRGRSSTASTRRGRSCTPSRPSGSPHRSDDRQRSRRHDHEALRRRRTAPPADGSDRRLRAFARHARRGPARELVWSTPSGKHVTVRSTRMVSLEHRHLGVITMEVEVDVDAPVVVSSQVLNRQDSAALDERHDVSNGHDPRRARYFTERVLNARTHVADGLRLVTGYQTTHSRMTMCVGVDHRFETENPCRTTTSWTEDLGKVVFTAQASAGVPIRIEKAFTYHTSRHVPAVELVDRGLRSLDRAIELGAEGLQRGQREELADFWRRADVTLEGPPRFQQAVRWNLFQLHQASARAETTGIPAKGLTGQAYEGHYFWDTEIYVAPFLTYTEPRITRNLLRFRESMLPQARERAAELSELGALFPWRTINGEEASSYYAAGTAQYHINADIAYALKRYVDVRGDTGILVDLGAEILVSTARMWAGLGFMNPTDDRFHIHGVTGPDEYTTVVNDNAFTNLMARRNLRYAAEVLTWLAEEDPAAHATLPAGSSSRGPRSSSGSAAPMRCTSPSTRSAASIPRTTPSSRRRSGTSRLPPSITTRCC